MTTLYLVRHGETIWNEQGRLQGSEVDESLSERGRAQARSIAAVLDDLEPDVVMASPLRRAIETADLGGRTTTRTDDRWTENALGEWSGRRIEDLLLHDGSRYRQWRHGMFTPPGGESFDHVKQRVVDAVDDLDAPTCALIFTHGGTIRAAVAALAGIDPARIAPARPGSLCVIETDETGGSLMMWNMRTDLPLPSSDTS